MATRHTVKQGDCFHSLAAKNGKFWQDLWNAPENQALRKKRSKPELICPGDVVVIPDKEIKEDSGATESRHKFRTKGAPVKLRVRFLDKGEPRPDEPYTLKVDGVVFEGTTDGDGRIEYTVPPLATEATLRLGEADSAEDYILHIGSLDPVEEVSGVQGRLHNLGYDTGEIDGVMGPITAGAIGQFQKDNDLEVTGQADQATRDKLVSLHES